MSSSYSSSFLHYEFRSESVAKKNHATPELKVIQSLEDRGLIPGVSRDYSVRHHV
jgi:hypothetical protein